MSDSLSISTEQVSVMEVRYNTKLDDIIVTKRDPSLAEDHQSWLMWWLVENRPFGMIQWWYVVDEEWGNEVEIEVEYLEEDGESLGGGNWNRLSRNYKTLGGSSGKGNYFVSAHQNLEAPGISDWENGRESGFTERMEIMARMVQGFWDETIGIEVDEQFFIENNGWYLAEQPMAGMDNRVRLFYRGSNDKTHGLVVEVTSDFMPFGVKNVGSLTYNDIETSTIRFLDENDSWVLPTQVLEVLNWGRFPTVFLE